MDSFFQEFLNFIYMISLYLIFEGKKTLFILMLITDLFMFLIIIIKYLFWIIWNSEITWNCFYCQSIK